MFQVTIRDDEPLYPASSPNINGPPVDGHAYTPPSPSHLSDFDGQNAVGTWTLTAQDLTTNDPLCHFSATLRVFVDLVLDVEVTDSPCFNEARGEVAVTPQGGSGKYQVVSVSQSPTNDDLSGATAGSQGSSFIFTGVRAGSFSVTIQEIDDAVPAHGASARTTVFVGQATQLVADCTGETTAIDCYDGDTGTLTVGGLGESPPFCISSVTPSEGADYSQCTMTASSLRKRPEGGSYQITIRDKNLCSATCEYDPSSDANPLEEPPEFSLSLLDHQDETCMNANDGAISLNAQGGNGDTFHIVEDAAYSTTNCPLSGPLQACGLPSDTDVAVIVENNSGCKQTFTAKIDSTPDLRISDGEWIRRLSCRTDPTGTREYNVFGGPSNAAYAVTVTDPTGGDLSVSDYSGSNPAYSTFRISGLTFDSVVTLEILVLGSSPRCSTTVEIGPFTSPTVQASEVSKTKTCQSDSGADLASGSATYAFSATGIVSPQFQLELESGVGSPTLPEVGGDTMSTLEAGEYTVRYRETGSDCVSERITTVIETSPMIQYRVENQSCPPRSATSASVGILLTVLEGDGPYDFSLVSSTSQPNMFSSTNNELRIRKNLNSNEVYAIEFTITGKYCMATLTYADFLASNPYEDYDMEIQNNNLLCYSVPAETSYALSGSPSSTPNFRRATAQSLNGVPFSFRSPNSGPSANAQNGVDVWSAVDDVSYALVVEFDTLTTGGGRRCTKQFSYTVDSVPEITVSDNSGFVCSPSSNIINLNIAGGVPNNDDFVVNNLSPDNGATLDMVSGRHWTLTASKAEQYTMTVTQQGLSGSPSTCSVMHTVTVEPVSLHVSQVTQTPVCNSETVSIVVSVTGFDHPSRSYTLDAFSVIGSEEGVGPETSCTLIDSPDSNTCQVDGLMPGDEYDIVVHSDSPESCSLSTVFTPHNVQPIRLSEVAVTAASCVSPVGGPDGSVTLSFEGGYTSESVSLVGVDQDQTLDSCEGYSCQTAGPPGTVSIGLLAPGTYYYRVKDAAGCTFDGEVTIPAATLSVSGMDDISCYNILRAMAVVESSKSLSSEDLTLLVEPPVTVTGLTASGFEPGQEYSVKVTETATECESETFLYTAPDTYPEKPAMSPSEGSLGCGNSETELSLSCSSGDSCSLSFISGDGGLVRTSDTSVSMVRAGQYTLHIENSRGCTTTSLFTVTGTTPLVASVVGTAQGSCYGSFDGAAEIQAEGSSGSFVLDASSLACTYGGSGSCPTSSENISGSSFSAAQTSTITGLRVGGEYSIRVADETDTSCFSVVSFTVTPGNPVVFEAADYSCIDQPRILVSNINGGNGAPYTIHVICQDSGCSEVEITAIDEASAFVEGVPFDQELLITVNDKDNCFSEATRLSLSQPPAFEVDGYLTESEPTCFGARTAVVTLVGVEGGDHSNGDDYEVTSTFGVQPLGGLQFTGVSNDREYAVEVKTPRGCLYNTLVQSDGPGSMDFSVTDVRPPTCPRTADGQLTIVPSGQNGPFTLVSAVLIGEASIPSPIINDPAPFVVRQIAAHDYLVTISDANGCEYSETISPGGQYSLSGQAKDEIRCSGESSGRYQITVVQGTASGPFYTSLLPSDGPEIISEDSDSPGTFVLSNIRGGISFTFEVINGNGCSAVLDFEMSDPTRLQVDLSLESAITCQHGSNGALNVGAIGGTSSASGNPFAITIAPTDGLSVSSFQDDEAFRGFRISGMVARSYSGIIRDSLGCEAAYSFTMTEPELIVTTPAQSTVWQMYQTMPVQWTYIPDQFGNDLPATFEMVAADAVVTPEGPVDVNSALSTQYKSLPPAQSLLQGQGAEQGLAYKPHKLIPGYYYIVATVQGCPQQWFGTFKLDVR